MKYELLSEKKLEELGEFGLIERFSKNFTKDLPSGVEGIGDDAAVIPIDATTALLVTTDMLVEKTHFLREFISAEDLGYKSLAVNLSDIAAMGGVPEQAFLSLGLTEDLSVGWVDGFFAGFEKLAREFNVLLLGGDTTRSKQGVVINVTVLGRALKSQIKRRSRAQPGDVICVTGHLGDSGAGLKALLENAKRDTDLDFLIQQHHRPRPHVKEGEWLGGQASVHAMMDISDGLASDLKHIVEKSSCGALVHLEKLPLSDNLMRACERLGWLAQELAVSAGEDYGLVLTLAPQNLESLKREFNLKFGRELFVIGKMLADPKELCFLDNGRPYDFKNSGWNHFAKIDK